LKPCLIKQISFHSEILSTRLLDAQLLLKPDNFFFFLREVRKSSHVPRLRGSPDLTTAALTAADPET